MPTPSWKTLIQDVPAPDTDRLVVVAEPGDLDEILTSAGLTRVVTLATDQGWQVSAVDPGAAEQVHAVLESRQGDLERWAAGPLQVRLAEDRRSVVVTRTHPAASTSRPVEHPAPEDAAPAPDAHLLLEGHRPVRADPTRQAGVWIPRALRGPLKQRVEAERMSVTEYVLDAFNRHYVHFDDYFGRRTVSDGPMPVRRMRRRRQHDEPPVQLWLYLTADEELVLDDAERTWAGSRSELVTRLLVEDLDVEEITA